MQRIVTAVVLMLLLWGVIRFAPPLAFTLVALAFIGTALWECYGMFERDGGRPFKWLGLASGLAVGWSFLGSAPRVEPELPLLLIAVSAMLTAMWRRDSPGEMLRTALTTVFPVLFVALGLSFLVGLRTMADGSGEQLLMLLFFCVILADTAAFYVGRALGKRPLAPKISPNKTWEGAIGGLAASVLGALIAREWFFQELPWVHTLVLGLSLGLAAIGGDLTESMVKRAVGAKDSSSLLPGHGGLLDRTDSLLLAGPLLYYYYRWLLQGTA